MGRSGWGTRGCWARAVVAAREVEKPSRRARWRMTAIAAPPAESSRSVPHEVASVAAGVLLQVVLVEVLGVRERAGVDDLGHDRRLPAAGGVDAARHLLGHAALLGRGHEDRRAVLRPAVVALPVLRGRVVHLVE